MRARWAWLLWLSLLAAFLMAAWCGPARGACDQPPAFGQWDDLPACPPEGIPTEPCQTTCSPEREQVQCGCSECLFWDPEPLASWYEVNRETVSSGTMVQVGSVQPRVVDEAGATVLPTTWCPPWDVPFPREGTAYRYRLRACNRNGTTGEPQCGPWTEPGVVYVAAPYWCGSIAESQCYVGDPVAGR